MVRKKKRTFAIEQPTDYLKLILRNHGKACLPSGEDTLFDVFRLLLCGWLLPCGRLLLCRWRQEAEQQFQHARKGIAVQLVFAYPLIVGRQGGALTGLQQVEVAEQDAMGQHVAERLLDELQTWAALSIAGSQLFRDVLSIAGGQQFHGVVGHGHRFPKALPDIAGSASADGRQG